jgi:tetratricopeptide (TPR) repeat protein
LRLSVTFYYKLEQWEKAIIHLEKSLKAPNRAQEARELLVLCYERTGKSDKAIQMLKPILKERPQDAILITQMGNLLLSTGEYAGAEKSFRRALKINPKLLPAHEGIVVSQALLERYDETENSLLEAVRRFPREPGFRVRLAEMYLKLGRPLDALTVIEQLKGLTGETKQIELLRNAAETILKAQGKLVPPK